MSLLLGALIAQHRLDANPLCAVTKKSESTENYLPISLSQTL